MRADNDHAIGNSVLESCKDESKPHKCLEEKWEDEENNSNVCELFYDTRSSHEWDKEHSCGDSSETRTRLQDNSHDSVAISDDSLEKVDPVFYMDKNVTACDFPEIVVCYKEKTYHVVKDISVDEGVLVQEKFLFSEKDSLRCNSNSHQCEAEDLVNPLETKSSEDRNCKLCNDPKANQDVEESSKDEVATTENVLKESSTLEEEQNPLNNNNNNSDKLEEQASPQLQEKEIRSLETTVLETEEKLSSVSTTTSQEPNSLEDNKLFLSGFGETSFSAAEPGSVSGHITYSGPVAFSGSQSVRSDASTTSGRSFAFPVLQSEWNCISPVRMAKANKKRQKGWRDILICCRFS